MRLSLEKCTIRTWCREDAESLVSHANNRNVWLGLRDRFPHPYPLGEANVYLARASDERPTTSFCIDVGNSAAGGIGVRLGDDVHRHIAELGFWLGETFWRRGIMTEVVRAFAPWAFSTFALRRLQADVFANNRASARVLENAEFTFEGRLRSNVLKDGVILDTMVYARKR